MPTAIVRIDGRDETVAGGLNGLEMTRRNETGDSGNGKVLRCHMRCADCFQVKPTILSRPSYATSISTSTVST